MVGGPEGIAINCLDWLLCGLWNEAQNIFVPSFTFLHRRPVHGDATIG